MQVWALRSGSCYKLGSVESEVVVKEKEVAMLSVYNQSYLALSVGEQVMMTKKDGYEDGDDSHAICPSIFAKWG